MSDYVLSYPALTSHLQLHLGMLPVAQPQQDHLEAACNSAPNVATCATIRVGKYAGQATAQH